MKSTGGKDLRPSARPGKDQGCRGRALFSAEAGGGSFRPRRNLFQGITTFIRVHPYRNRCLHICVDICVYTYIYVHVNIHISCFERLDASLQFEQTLPRPFQVHFNLLQTLRVRFLFSFLKKLFNQTPPRPGVEATGRGGIILRCNSFHTCTLFAVMITFSKQKFMLVSLSMCISISV